MKELKFENRAKFLFKSYLYQFTIIDSDEKHINLK